MSGSRLHSINESRWRLGNIGRDAVYDLLNSGQLEAKKIGRRTFITEESIESYIQNLPPFLRPPRAPRQTSSTISRFRASSTASRQKSNRVLGASKSSRLPGRKRNVSKSLMSEMNHKKLRETKT
jgi:hypothetical protein